MRYGGRFLVADPKPTPYFSIIFGATLPLLLKSLNVDPAHSSTSIQVVMDILGVVLTVLVSTMFLDSPFGEYVVHRLLG